MSIDCTEMARKVRKKHNEQIGAGNDEEMEKNCEDKSAVCREKSKSKWRRLLLQSRNATKIAYCVVGH